MNIFRTPKHHQKALRKKPESGMGYQIIYDQGLIYIVLNLFLTIPFDDFKSPEFYPEFEEYLSGDPDAERFKTLNKIELDNPRIVFSDFQDYLDIDQSTDLTNDLSTFNTSDFIKKVKPQSHPRAPQSFYRYSAYYKDKRVDPSTGNYADNTYATTFNDMHHVPSGFSAVGRYALPNASSAKYVFPILTYDNPSYMGTATPNFGQAGGGVEVYFKNGAKNEPGKSFGINEG